MGTRGMMAFSLDGETKSTYVHWDSYPEGLGKDIGNWIATADIADAIEKFKALEVVDENVPPTDDQKLRLLKYADLGVSTRSLDDWYVLLRDTQGDPQAVLDAGFYIDGEGISGQEWHYNIDLGKEELTISDYPGYGSTTREFYVIPFDSLRAGSVDFDVLAEDIHNRLENED